MKPKSRSFPAALLCALRLNFPTLQLIALIFVIVFPIVSCGPSEKERPNLVLVVFDALRADHVGAYGYEKPTTPNLDRLARDSILFSTAYSSAAFTLPSMATLFTSLEPMRHGVRRHLDPDRREDRLDERFNTLAETLREQGYSTGAVVSNSLFLLKCGFDQGFESFIPGRRRDAGPTTDEAIAWLRKQQQEKEAEGECEGEEGQPFFLWVHYIDPHWPYDAPQSFDRPFSLEDRGRFQRLVRRFEQGRVRSDEIYFECPLDEDGLQRGIAEYDNEIAYADHHFGRLLEHLEKSGLYDKTLVAVVSDHGEAMGEHGLHFAHSFFLYEEVERVVMTIKPPKGKGRACRVDHPVRLLDFMPTVLPLLGIDARASHEGIDLGPLWMDREKAGAASFPDLPIYGETEPRYVNAEGRFRYPARKRVFMDGNQGKWRMLRSGKHKLILIPGEGVELYDLEADPLEKNNIAEQQPGIVRELSRTLEAAIEHDRQAAEVRGHGEGGSGGGALSADEKEALDLIREMGY